MFLPKHTPLESVAEAQRRAKKRLPHSVYVAVLAGSEKGITMDQNVAAFDQIGFRPRVGVGFPPVREMSTTVLGQEISLPVIISPAGVQAIAPGGEVPVARAAAQVGTAIGQSTSPACRLRRLPPRTPRPSSRCTGRRRVTRLLHRQILTGKHYGKHPQGQRPHLRFVRTAVTRARPERLSTPSQVAQFHRVKLHSGMRGRASGRGGLLRPPAAGERGWGGVGSGSV